MNNYKDELNNKQYDAVTYFDSPLLILAGAGSGKTRVLTYKIAYIIEVLKENPYSIFAVTFTNKAASEMKERVSSLLGISVNSMWIGTFHSMCVRIIKMYRRKMGEKYNFTIYDSQDSKTLVKKLIKQEDEMELNPKICRKTISNLKNKMISPAEFSKMTENYIQEKICKIYYLYEKFLKENNALDFDSLLLETVNILKNDPSFKKQLNSMFKYILVDEYQDTNEVQYELLKMLYSKNHISVVGDDDQSIYAFRGAKISNILDFDKDFKKTKVIKLEQNYRSTKKILNAASDVISNNCKRKEKRLWSELPDGDNIKIINAIDERDEAKYITHEIIRLSKKSSYSHSAVLYRTNAQSRPLEEMFRSMSVPYAVIGGMKFFERKEIKDIIAYLNLVINRNDGLSLLRIINVPRRGIGKKGIDSIMNLNKRGIPFEEIIMNTDTYKNELSLQTFQGIKSLRKVITIGDERSDNAFEAISSIVEESKYNDFLDLMDTIESTSRKENVQELINSAYEFVGTAEDITLASYIDMISLYTDTDDMESIDEKVYIMTVHNAKGLEFENIFVSGMEEGLFPHINSFETEDGLEEERRLFYVAMTRAKKHLFITYANSRNHYGNRTINGISMFLNELPVKGTDNEFTFFHNQKITIKCKKGEKQRKGKMLFNINEVVIHPFWGNGVITGIKGSGDNTIANIRFYSVGIKKIYVKYANLQRKDK